MPGPVVTLEVLDRILDAWERGLMQREIAEELGIKERTINTAICRARAAGNPRAAKKGEAEAAQRRVDARRRAGLLQRTAPPVPVPAWARNAGLSSDYLSYAKMWGEEQAASLCRKLKADMTRGFAG